MRTPIRFVLSITTTTLVIWLGVIPHSRVSSSSSSGDFFTYSQSLHVDLSDYVPQDDIEPPPSSSSSSSDGVVVVSSSLLYEGRGGADASMFAMEDGDDSDNDDDDDDDGHSSMLSNASLRRNRLVQSFSLNKWMADAPFTTTTKPSNVHHVLSLRGGGASSQTTAAVVVWKQLLATALVTLIFEALLGHILEFLKIVLQTSSHDISYAQVVHQITSSKGVVALWDGFLPWGVVQAVSKGAVFGWAYATALAWLKPYADQNILPLHLALTLAGGIGGGFQGYVLSPTLLLKTRVMTNPVFRTNMSLLRTTWLSLRIGFDIVKSEGIGTLMKGSHVFAMKRVFDWASRYFFADLFEALVAHIKGGEPLTLFEKSISSLLGGVASTCVTLPLDVLVAKTQDAKKAGVKVNALALFLDELKDSGWNGLRHNYMRGFEARLLHVCLTTLVIKTGTPLAYNVLFPPSPT